jgi:hypothetical protein
MHKQVHKIFLKWPSNSNIMCKAILYSLISQKLVSSDVVVLMLVLQASVVITWHAKC